MKLKLTNEELKVLIENLKSAHFATFNTTFESRLCGSILREFTQSLMKKAIDLREKTSISLDDKTILVLNHILPQIYPPTPFEQSVMIGLITKLNQQCLSIS